MDHLEISPLSTLEIDTVIEIWLESSIRAHSFIPPEYWQSKVNEMKNIWLPNSETWILKSGNKIVGFYSLVENRIAALFLLPSEQGKGLGKQLLEHAKMQRTELTLTVYKENVSAYSFYLSQGFSVSGEQSDEQTGQLEYIMQTNGYLT